MAIKLSVVIPCYNMGDFVIEALDSVLSYKNQDIIQVIIVNDGSDDNKYTKKILETVTKKNVTVIHQENQGLGAARNNGIAIAKGKYILPLDADNKIRHEYIDESIMAMDNDSNIGLCYGNLERFGTVNDIVYVGEFDISRLIVKNYIDACVVYRKTAWESINGYDQNMPVMGYEDWDFNLRLFFKGWQYHYIDKICFDYRVRVNSMLSNTVTKRNLLVEYIFNKQELVDVNLLRDNIFELENKKNELNNFKKRKMIKLAMKLEEILKSHFKLK